MNEKQTLIIIAIFDLIVGLVFTASNWYIWSYFNDKLTVNVWGPFQTLTILKVIAGGEAVTIGTFTPVPNYPFILFWTALAGNLILFALALRSGKKTQEGTPSK